MSSGVQQLKEDFKQVQKLLEIYPNIKITNTEGDPPEQYDIEYIIKGYKTSPEGDPTPDNNHEVRITLPFGYPHFPPTVKPITPIFHPDIDPDAIRIADFWQENHSLPDLIVHIGQMICGNHYTRDEPFNQNAFEWFEERSSWLPFDILEPRDEDETEKVETSAVPTDTEAQKSFAPATDLDILKDDIDFPFDEDEEYGEPGDEISLDLEEDTVIEDLTGQEEAEPVGEITFDLEKKDSAETLDLQESEDGGTEDFFSLETEETEDDFSFDLTDDPAKTEAVDGSSSTGDLFDLETETTGEESGEETPLEFDSEDIAFAFEEEAEPDDITLDDLAGLDEEEDALDFGFTDESMDIEDEAEPDDITLDDLAGLDEKEDALDFGLADESMDIEDEATADLSGLFEDTREEESEETEPEPDETGVDEEKILSALTLNEEFSFDDKLGEKSQVILSLIEQKQIFSAKKVLTELPDPDSLPDKKELELTITDAVSEAEDLYKKADNHEQKGEFEKAGILLDLVANIAIDFPGLDFARNRIRESMMSDGRK